MIEATLDGHPVSPLVAPSIFCATAITHLFGGSGGREGAALQLGGSIANPMNIRLGRGLVFPGTREDTLRITAEIVEIHEKASAPKGESTKNWAGETVVREDKGRRLRAILALGSQDISSGATLHPLEEGIEFIIVDVAVLECNSINDIVDTGKDLVPLLLVLLH